MIRGTFAFWVASLIVWGVLLLGTTPAPASSLVIDADAQFGFAESYFQEEQYFKAISEYERFLHFFPEDPRTREARLRIADAYARGGRPNEAMAAYQKALGAHSDDPDVVTRSYLGISDALKTLNQTDQAEGVLRRLMAITDDQETADETRYRIVWLRLEKGEWAGAAQVLREMSPGSRIPYRVDDLTQALAAAEEIPRKNPALAGAFSIVPGGGYLYCGRYRDALVAFLLNGGLILASVEAFQDDNYALGGLLGFVGGGFYAGNIYGGIASAHKYNRDQNQTFIDRLREDLRVQVSGHSGGIALGFRVDF